MTVLLDTCALLWLASGSGNLTRHALERIDEAGVVYVSAISGFEIALKWRRGKLRLPASPDEWLNAIVAHHSLSLVPITVIDALRAPQLPDVHRDPCDRFIIATAERLHADVATTDERFPSYGIATFC